MAYQFYDEPSLGKVVLNVKPFSKLTKNMDVPQEKDIVGDFADPVRYPGLAGRKWSRLCGFTFKMANGQKFQFVYVPKLKGTLSRNQQALSGWYCWSLPSNDPDTKQVTSINDVKKRYGFDINKFVHSDVFDKYIALFKSNAMYTLDHQVKELLEMPKEKFNDYKELVRYVNAVKDSIAKMDDVKKVVMPDDFSTDDAKPDYAKGSAPKVGHAKIAYNADKTYDLRNDTKQSQQKELRRRVVDKIASQLSAKDKPIDVQNPVSTTKKQYIKFDPSLRNKTSNATVKTDSEIFDKYDDYDNDDYR